MKPRPQRSKEIREQIEALRAIAAPPGVPLPDDFAAQAQMLADKWHLEDLEQELRAAKRTERARAGKPRSSPPRRPVAA
ncbi:MAG: hypothetical protein HYY24_09645 [Verrucomicrobia bacterium]|nr:hypothetical protein [Verrucomicrobiota bacterium]